MHNPDVQLKKLYAVSSTGKTKHWQIGVVANPDGTATVTTRHGYVDGKTIVTPKIIREGKNIGRSNETTPYQQAVAETLSDFQKKLDKKYSEHMPGTVITTSDALQGPLLPMLAQTFSKRKHDITYPCFVQPKLNGVRCLTQKISKTQIEFTSRGGKDFNATTLHLIKPLLDIMEIGEILDGELYVHGWSLQKIVKTVKKLRPWAAELQYHIYDVADAQRPFHQRAFEIAERVDGDLFPPIIQVRTLKANSESDVYHMHDMFVEEGYEGAIIRNAGGYYKFDHRSKDLQKHKNFIDEEFKIVDVMFEEVAGGGRAIMFVCVQEEGKAFKVRPKGSMKDRIRMWNDRMSFIGKNLTVRYQSRSDDNIPTILTGIVRDYE